MAAILCIETSTEVCSVALSIDGNLVEEREDKNGKNHAQLLTGFVEEVMSAKKIRFSQLNAIAVSGGSGSYTGLRIGVSTAKGLCYAAGLPLIAIPSLEVMAHHVINNLSILGFKKNESLLYCPMIDARRMEVYAAIYNNQLEKVREIRADIIDHLSFTTFLQNQKILFFGNGADKCKMTLQHPNALFLDNISTSASYMAAPAEAAYLAGNFMNVAYYEPFYLKDFVATIPTKNIFHSQKDQLICFRMKKILIITYYWPPSGGAGVQRWLKFSKYLPEFGYEPIVLTVDEKQASYAQLDYSLLQEISPELSVHKTKTFEPYNLYRKLTNKKEIPYGGFSNQKKVTFFEKLTRFIRGNLFIPDPRKGWNRYALKKNLRIDPIRKN